MTVLSAQFAAVDREAILAALFAYLKGKLTAPPWTAGATITAGQVVTDTQGHLQQAQSNGVAGSSAPAWNDAGGVTSDGSGGGAFTWLDTGPGFVSMGRKHVMPPRLKIADQPALFQVSAKEMRIPQKPPGAPAKLLLKALLILYLYNPSPQEDVGLETTLGETLLNGLLKAIDNALLPDDPNTGKFTVGGLVTHCWIEGEASLDPGIFGNQCAALLPLHLLID